jgi:hypothetical protein
MKLTTENLIKIGLAIISSPSLKSAWAGRYGISLM